MSKQKKQTNSGTENKLVVARWDVNGKGEGISTYNPSPDGDWNYQGEPLARHVDAEALCRTPETDIVNCNCKIKTVFKKTANGLHLVRPTSGLGSRETGPWAAPSVAAHSLEVLASLSCWFLWLWKWGRDTPAPGLSCPRLGGHQAAGSTQGSC